jgi:glucosamine-6-phosphate deaminase
MVRVIIIDRDYLSAFVADKLKEQLIQKPNSVLGLATGSTPLILYRELAARSAAGSLCFADVTSFNLDEYIGLKGENDQSYRYYMNQNLFQHVDIKIEHTHVPNGLAKDLEEECLRYDNLMEQAGGVDWQLLGIGLNGHIGFNEPNNSLVAETNVAELKEETRLANARFFSSVDEVPTHAITVGIGGILKAKKIIMLAIGQDKAGIIYEALTGPVSTQIPASFLQLHQDVTVILDPEAATLLPKGLNNSRMKVERVEVEAMIVNRKHEQRNS